MKKKKKHHLDPKARRRRQNSEAQTRRRWIAKGFRWVKAGGGTMLIRIPGHIRFPSDDTYENLLTGELVEFTCTTEAHFKMPRAVSTLRQIQRLPGVNPRFRRIKNGDLRATRSGGAPWTA